MASSGELPPKDFSDDQSYSDASTNSSYSSPCSSVIISTGEEITSNYQGKEFNGYWIGNSSSCSQIENRTAMPLSFPYGDITVRQIYPNFNLQFENDYPYYFQKGTPIHLANNQVKNIQDLAQEDFIACAKLYPELKLDTSRIVYKDDSSSTEKVVIGFITAESNQQTNIAGTNGICRGTSILRYRPRLVILPTDKDS
ncbi:uncharacterized protein TRIADDRAFT_55611 [Trichoplax adhaerens]|uniref:AXH domain-containing protein n=1 Tax=Trichoplax adhaerens TaxID=10228 RepID=B3RVD2_TRIAD|nr:hypothetical protein TRIADDRAFT_55611 [Trichoplax adhaerens]EDV25481.1 hypothetical protein TRIADDRAFT_55611 [Trichoplax adhaerens]|eukprot:XP_002111514.1 hypothetical protein TRIADDRAFT_55611 [Trichoplax adhaerens]